MSIETPEQLNGHAPSRPKFDTKEWWLDQPDLAVDILILWRSRAPAQFGAYLAEVLTGSKPKGGRS